MPDNLNKPSLATILESEHQALSKILNQARQELASTTRNRTRIYTLVTQLSELTEAHFRHEEQGGYMTEGLACAPQLIARAEILQEQHSVLQEEIDKLQLLIQSGIESQSWWDRIQSDFNLFADRLSTHEYADSRLLQEALNQA